MSTLPSHPSAGEDFSPPFGGDKIYSKEIKIAGFSPAVLS
jgi:hypothetical protein